MIWATVAVYIVGALIAGYLGGRYAWRNGKHDQLPSYRKSPHDSDYAWQCAFGYGLFWPVLIIACVIACIVFAVIWPFTTGSAKRLAGKLWGS